MAFLQSPQHGRWVALHGQLKIMSGEGVPGVGPPRTTDRGGVKHHCSPHHLALLPQTFNRLTSRARLPARGSARLFWGSWPGSSQSACLGQSRCDWSSSSNSKTNNSKPVTPSSRLRCCSPAHRGSPGREFSTYARRSEGCRACRLPSGVCGLFTHTGPHSWSKALLLPS